MQVSVLASGSKGNAVFVAMDGVRLLIDAGISATRIKKALAAEGVDAADLDAVLITHDSHMLFVFLIAFDRQNILLEYNVALLEIRLMQKYYLDSKQKNQILISHFFPLNH